MDSGDAEVLDYWLRVGDVDVFDWQYQKQVFDSSSHTFLPAI